jgi:hypothetical protein
VRVRVIARVRMHVDACAIGTIIGVVVGGVVVIALVAVLVYVFCKRRSEGCDVQAALSHSTCAELPVSYSDGALELSPVTSLSVRVPVCARICLTSLVCARTVTRRLYVTALWGY